MSDLGRLVPKVGRKAAGPLLLALAVMAGSAPASGADADGDIALNTQSLPAMHPGQTAWVSTLWRGAPVDATDFELTANPPKGLTVTYPANTGKFSSLYKSSTLLAGDTDYAALKIEVGPDVIGNQEIRLRVDYALSEVDSKGKTKSRRRHQNLDVTMAVVEVTGNAVEQTTTTVGPIPAGDAQWVQVVYTGVKLGVSGVSIRVTDPAGATITYPGSRSSTSLRGDDTLDVGETDSAAFKIDTANLAPGSYRLGLSFDYGDGQSLPEALTLEVR